MTQPYLTISDSLQDAFKTMSIDLANNPFWCPLPAWPTIYSATCQHCPTDTIINRHRTCSDHGVCVNGITCQCDPEWAGVACDKLECLNFCNYKGDCTNEVAPSACDLGNGTDPTTGMCLAIEDNCVAAYHDCPHKGISSQVPHPLVAPFTPGCMRLSLAAISAAREADATPSSRGR